MYQKTAQTQNQKKSDSGQQQTFLDHLRELRGRLFIVALVLLVGGSIGYTFHDFIIQILLLPLHGQKLMYITPGGGFDFIFKASFYAGCLLTVPMLIYQLYRYLAPLLGRRSRRMTLAVIGFSITLAVCGILFGFYIALPAALNFLTNVGNEYLQASLTASSYLNFIMAYLLGLAVLFQLPLILLIINAANGPLPPEKLWKTQQYVIPGTFILSAIITPTPDMANQIILAAPVIAIYEIGVGLVLLQNRKHRVRSNSIVALKMQQNQVSSKPLPVFYSQPKPQNTPPLRGTAVSELKPTPLSTPPIRRHMDVLTPQRPTKIHIPQRSISSQLKKASTRPSGVSIDGVLLPSRTKY